MADTPIRAPIESVHSPAVAAHISHAVIAAYAAAAAREVVGVQAITDGSVGLLDRRTDVERAPRGVRVSADGDRIDVELRLVADWGARLPDLALAVQDAVRVHLTAMIQLEVGEVTVVVEDVAAPA